MWADGRVRVALVARAASGEPAEARQWALTALRSLADAAANRELMWADGEARAVLLAGAASGEPAEVRENALTALRHLTPGGLSKEPRSQVALIAASASGEPAAVCEVVSEGERCFEIDDGFLMPVYAAKQLELGRPC